MKDQTIEVDGVSIRYRDSGGPGLPVLLSHGIGGSLELWSRQLEQLGPRLRLIAWDYPGHGLSGMGDQPYDIPKFARFAWRLVDALGHQRMLLAGNSLGAAISVHMAALAPERCAGLLLANAAALGKEVLMPFRLMSLRGLGELMGKPGPAAVQRQITAIVRDPSVVSPELRQVIARNDAKPGGGKAFLATLRSVTGLGGQRRELVETMRSMLRSMRCPVLFVHGQHDVVLPAAHSVAAQALTPDSRVVVLDCGHTPQLEKPAEFNALLEQLAAA
jgi:pimeloyl-ACP methyl ester carboxylesterase